MTKTHMGQRIREVRERAKLTQADLGKAAGVSASAVSQWESGNTKGLRPENLLAVAKKLECSVEYLVKGEGARELDKTGKIRRVPLISWVQAGSWSDAIDQYHVGEGEKPMYTTKDVGPHAYALRVRGDSMENPKGKPTYPAGCIIIVDPDRSPKPGDRVIVRLENSKEVTFKEYFEDAGEKWLRPLNPQYIPMKITERATFCGVVVQTIIDEE